MQVTVDSLSSIKKKMNIEVPQEEVARELDTAYRELKKTAKIKGFRPGKVPMSVLRNRFQKDVNADVASKLIQASFFEALQETELKMVGQPEIDPPELSTSEPLRYSAVIEIQPEIGDLDYKGLALKKTAYTVSDEEVEAQLQMLRKNLTRLNPIEEERPVRADDFVLVDYEGFLDGHPFAETQKTENFSMKIGNAMIAKDFDDQLIGAARGETRQVTVDFPEDYFNKKLAGKKIDFQVEIKDIREEEVPDIDDDLAKRVGNYETLDALKEAIVKNLEQGYEKRSEQELNEQIFEALLEKVEFEVPSAIVESELEGILQEAERSFQYHNMSMEQIGMTRESLAEKYRGTAEKQARRHLILGKLIEQESLSLSDEELTAGFQEVADSVNQPVDGIRQFYEANKEQLEFFKHTLLEKNAVKLIIDNATVAAVEPEKEEKSEA